MSAFTIFKVTEDPILKLRQSIAEQMKMDCFLLAQQNDFLTDSYTQRSDLGFLVGTENKLKNPELPKVITLQEFIKLKPLLKREITTFPTQITDIHFITKSKQTEFEIWEYNYQNESFSFSCEAIVQFDGDIPLPKASGFKINRRELT